MRKVLLSICVIALAVLVLAAVAGKTKAPAEAVSAGDGPRFTSVSEAAFSMRSTGSENATSRLVGSFLDEHGEKYVFNGFGEVKRVAQNLSSVTGSYTLLQSADGAAILDMTVNGEQAIYSFAITSPEGQFTLTDANGGTEIFTPVAL